MSTAGNQSRSCVRRWGFRLAAVLLGLLLLGLAEGLCVLAGWGAPSLADDPFVGFAAVHPLFELNADGTEYAVPASRRKFFAAESFAAQKPAGSRRVFCLGGSTVQGRPYSIPTAFSTWLELALNELDPQQAWDVINCGGISYASYRLVPILQECLTHQPDLIVLCTGHNEFLEDRTYGDVRRSPWLAAPSIQWWSRSRLVTLARGWWERGLAEPAGLRSVNSATAGAGTERRTILPADAAPRLDYRRGLEAYHRDEAWRAGVVLHFDQNVRRMVRLARSACVPLVLMQPASNLGQQPPFKSEHRAGLTPAELSRWEQVVQEARDAYRSDLPRAIGRLRQALEIDDQYALTYYELGRCLESRRELGAARAAFVKARDLDICPLRLLSEQERALRQIADEFGLPFVNMHTLLEAETSTGILGDYWLVDHIHPSVRGHQLVAGALVEQLAALDLLTISDDWRTDVEPVWQRHLEAIDVLYFLQGQRTLESLRGWTRGEAEEIRTPEARAPGVEAEEESVPLQDPGPAGAATEPAP